MDTTILIIFITYNAIGSYCVLSFVKNMAPMGLGLCYQRYRPVLMRIRTPNGNAGQTLSAHQPGWTAEVVVKPDLPVSMGGYQRTAEEAASICRAAFSMVTLFSP